MNNKERVSKIRPVGVYEFNTPSDCQPDSYMDSDDAERKVRNGDAQRINRGKAIRLLGCSARRSLTHLRGLSAKPDDKLIERQAIAMNSGLDGAAVVAVQAWIGPVKLKVSRQGCINAG